MRDLFTDNVFLMLVIGLGIFLTVSWATGEQDERGPLGAAFIIAGCVGVYMMLTTRKVARNLHERFNETNSLLREIVSTQKELVSSQKEMSASQKEMASTLKDISQKLDVLSGSR